MYKNMKITIHLASPVAVSGYLYLDGILAAAVMKEKLKDEYFDKKPNESELIEIELPLDKKYGVWCASVGFGDNREFVTSWTKRWENKYDDIIKFNEKAKMRVDIATGYFKNYHMPLIIKSYKQIIFYCRGNIAEVRRLLTTYITHIGKKASQGYGEIANITVEEIEEDYSLFKDGMPTRPIPVKQYHEYMEYCMQNGLQCNIQLHPANPPYWRTDNLIQCYMPV